MEGLAPLPKSQLYITPDPVLLVLVKLIGDEAQTVAGCVYATVGVSFIVTIFERVSEHIPLVTINKAFFAPEEAYSIPVGFLTLAAEGLAPDPNNQEKVLPVKVSAA